MSQQYPERMEQGPVEAQNDRGIKVGGTWYDFGNFYEGERPTTGQEVELVATGRFIKALKIDGVDAGGSSPRGSGGTTRFGRSTGDDDFGVASHGQDDAPGSWGSGSAAPRRAAPAAPAARPVPAPVKASARASLRAAALAAAAHFHSGKAASEEDAVYATAERFFAWLTSDDD